MSYGKVPGAATRMRTVKKSSNKIASKGTQSPSKAFSGEKRILTPFGTKKRK